MHFKNSPPTVRSSLSIGLTLGLGLLLSSPSFARLPYLEPDEPVSEKIAAETVVHDMTCKDVSGVGPSFTARFVMTLAPNLRSLGGSVSNEAMGRCFADEPRANYDASKTHIVYNYSAGGNLCQSAEGTVSFEMYLQRDIKMARRAVLVIKDKSFNCQL